VTFKSRLTWVWGLLCAITLLSWWIGARHGHAYVPNAAITFGVVAIAAVKVRMIIMEFMGARQAPKLLRRIADGWLALLVASLLGIYAFGMGLHL
jgi:hypothetical protein